MPPVKPESWVQVNEKRYPSWINETFEQYLLPKSSKTRNTTTANKTFRPYQYQELLRDLMQESSPYRGILLYHGLGSGKTCSAILIAEQLKIAKESIVVMLPASLIPNFIEEGLKFCGDPVYKEYSKIEQFEPYKFISYNASNTVAQLKKLGNLNNKVIIIEEVHNLVSMMCNENSKKGKLIYEALMNAENCKIVAMSGTPIVNEPYEIGVLLNILRGYIEITQFSIEHLAVPKGKKWDYNKLENELKQTPSVDYSSVNLKNRTVDIHFRIKSWNPASHHNRNEPNHETGNNENWGNTAGENIGNVGVNNTGNAGVNNTGNAGVNNTGNAGVNNTGNAGVNNTGNAGVNNTGNVGEMNGGGPPSYGDEFKAVVSAALKTAKKNGAELHLLKVVKYTLFPEGDREFAEIFIDSTNPVVDKLKNVEILKRRMTGLISYYAPMEADYPRVINHEPVEIPLSNYQFVEYQTLWKAEKKSVMGRKYRIYTRQLSNFVFPPEVRRPGFDEVAALIKKKEEDPLIQEEENSPAKRKQIEQALIELKAGSAEYFTPTALKKYSPKMLAVLEKVQAAPGLVFVYSDFRTLEGVGIFSLILEQNGFTKYSGGKVGPGLRYAMYTGDEDMRERKAIIKLFRSDANSRGELIKVILATKAGAEGLDLKNIREIHILEPYWNEVRADQVIGRGVRRRSHVSLPEADREVEVFRYLTVFTAAQEREMRASVKSDKKVTLTTDQQIYQLALKKKRVTDEILQIMKMVAIDCVLNLKQNPPGIVCHTYGNDVSGLAYLPQIAKDLATGPVGTRVIKRRELVLGGKDKKGRLYIVDTRARAILSISDSKPIKPPPKIAEKVWLDLDNKLVYDYELAKTGTDQPPVGQISDAGVFVVV